MFYCPDITTNLKNKNFSIHEVEDWKVTIPSYDLFPTVPLTFDKVFWNAYWPIVNDPVLGVRKVMMKLEKERKENEMKKMSEKINTRNPLMQRKNSTSVVSKQQQGSEEERGLINQKIREKNEAVTMSELTVCLLMDRFVPW